MAKSIYLCGFMGSGKSFIGEKAANIADANFLDLDKFIEQREKKSIQRIFAEEGESYFRELEVAAISRTTEGYIIALGGGALASKKNASVINEYGISVFLDVKFETCYSRIKGDVNRPLAAKSTKKQLEKLYNDRKKYYMLNSKYSVDGNLPADEIAERVAEIYKEVNGN